jgi:hypothetical protein
MEQRWYVRQGEIGSIIAWNRLVDQLRQVSPIQLPGVTLTEEQKILLKETVAPLRKRSTVARE